MPISSSVPLVITPGEPAGIGPDLVLQLAHDRPELPLTVIADRNLLAQRAQLLGLPMPLESTRKFQIIHLPLAVSSHPGELNVSNVSYVLTSLQMAVAGCLAGKFRALVTGPVHKGIINQAGISFTGHTEYLAQLTAMPISQIVMLMVAKTFRVALVTTHLPLSQVSIAVTAERLRHCIQIIDRYFRQYFAITQPRILVCGLNPHAGEQGHLGREEIDVIIPTLQQLQNEGYQVRGPVPADTAFLPGQREQSDVILAMYHDQGLPVIKTLGFGEVVNITLGLPIIRTSVDHGTALELAGTGRASNDSLLAALDLASDLASRRLENQSDNVSE